VFERDDDLAQSVSIVKKSLKTRRALAWHAVCCASSRSKTEKIDSVLRAHTTLC
jgi:hypothetical protein